MYQRSTCALSAVCLQTGSAVGLLNTGHGLSLWWRYWSGHKRVLSVVSDWTMLPLGITYTNSLSLTTIHTHTHTHINTRAHRAWMEFVHNCVSGLIHLEGKKNVFFGADQHANNRGKGREGHYSVHVNDSVTVDLCHCALSDYNMANCSPEDLMAGEQRTIV